MNLRNFKEEIDKVILDRGYDYYRNEHILDLYEQENQTYIFEIEGTTDYEVVVQLDNNENIIYSYCNCPYDFGMICKHEVAAYFKLQEYLYAQKQEKTNTKKETMEEVLNTFSKEQLIDLLLPVIKKDKKLEKKVLSKYGKLNVKQDLQHFKIVIETIVDKYVREIDYLYYEEAQLLIEQLWNLAISIEPLCEVEEKAVLSLDKLFLLLEQGIELYNYYDDDGLLEEFINDLFYRIDTVVAESLDYDERIQEQILRKILGKSNESTFKNVSYVAIQLLQSVLIYGFNPTYRDLLYKKIQEHLQNADLDSRERLVIMQFELLQYHRTNKEIEQYIDQHIEINFFREMYFTKLMNNKQYAEAIQVAIESKEKAKNDRYKADKWKKLMFEAYKAQGDIQNLQSLAKEFLLGGNFKYYEDLKQIHKQNEQEFYKHLKVELKDNYYTLFIQLIEKENDLEEIMNIIRENPHTLLKYMPLVIRDYREEVLAIYQRLIEYYATRANARNNYREVCQLILDFHKYENGQKAISLIEKLKRENVRKRAFMEELNNCIEKLH